MTTETITKCDVCEKKIYSGEKSYLLSVIDPLIIPKTYAYEDVCMNCMKQFKKWIKKQRKK